MITSEMQYVAQRENLAVKLIRDEVARGRMIIPANIHHPISSRCASAWRPNARSTPTSATPSTTSNIDEELEKLQYAVKYGADTVMDLSTGGDIPRIRQAIIDASPVPIGTVPIYEALSRVRRVEDLNINVMLEVIEEQAEQGVDYMTIHAGVLVQYVPLTTKRITGIVSRGGAILAEWMVKNHKQNLLLRAFRRDLQDLPEARCQLFAGRRTAARLPGRRQRCRAVRGTEDAGRTDQEGLGVRRSGDDRRPRPHPAWIRSRCRWRRNGRCATRRRSTRWGRW